VYDFPVKSITLESKNALVTKIVTKMTVATQQRKTNSTKVPNIAISTKNKLWTKKGLERLGELINFYRKEEGWSLEVLSHLILSYTGQSASPKTLGNIENNIGMPSWNNLAAIATLGFVKNPKTGQVLTEFDFVDIASENLTVEFGMELPIMIRKACEINGVKREQYLSLLNKLNTVKMANLSEQRFDLICQGIELPTDDELRVIRVLVDPHEKAFKEKDWLVAAGLATLKNRNENENLKP
jgi:transcriptional regulator with XRE-family HTH domain